MTERKGRISPKVRTAIEAMVDHALSRGDAANSAGITDNWLYSQLRRPEVQAYRHERMQVLRAGEASRTIQRIANLADGAESEHVRLQASTWLGEIEGIAPVARSENVHVVHGITPGLVVVFQAPAAPALPDADVLVIEQPGLEAARQKLRDSLPKLIPHPADRPVTV